MAHDQIEGKVDQTGSRIGNTVSGHDRRLRNDERPEL
jgi:hypothetical protein